ncbi:MAG: DUF268 domain-containing protein [Bacteroidota bacterium]
MSLLLDLKVKLAEVKKKNEVQKEYREFVAQASTTTSRFDLDERNNLYLIHDKTATTPYERHYVYHPAWAARVLARTKPAVHVDISSTIKFATVVSAFIPVDYYDYRPANLHLSDLNSKAADLLDLPFDDNAISSLSCMHTLEHVGLGRYGDELDYDGDIKGMNELERVLAPGGDLLIVVPIGKPKLVFNAHRIYSYQQIINQFSNLNLQEYALIPDDEKDGHLIIDATEEMTNKQSWGCGCFWFKK